MYYIVRTIWFGGIGTFWAQKVIQEKLTKFRKILNCIKSPCIMLCAKLFGYSHYIYCLQEESIHFGLRVLKKFDLKVSGRFGQSIMQEKLPKFPTIFELHQVLIRSKMFWYLQIIQCQHIIKAFLPLSTRFYTKFSQ